MEAAAIPLLIRNVIQLHGRPPDTSQYEKAQLWRPNHIFLHQVYVPGNSIRGEPPNLCIWSVFTGSEGVILELYWPSMWTQNKEFDLGFALNVQGIVLNIK